jgi:hypothetical protein
MRACVCGHVGIDTSCTLLREEEGCSDLLTHGVCSPGLLPLAT